MTSLPPLESLRSSRILVLGDVMLDEYVWGEVSRISPEAPVPVIAGRHREFKAGGAGSVVDNLAVLGAKVLACGLVGDDEGGRSLQELLGSEGADCSGVIVSSERPTIRKTRVMAYVQHANRGQQQILRVDWEEVQPPTPNERVRIGRFLEETFANPPEVVLISDYEKGLLDTGLLEDVLYRARQHSVPVLVDPGRSVDYSRYRGASLICPNRYEAEQATGRTLSTPEEYRAAGIDLLERLELDHVALTLDREGIFLVSRGASGEEPTVRSFPTEVRAVTDVAGAGDMVLSLLGLAIASGWSVEHAIRLANVGAGIEVSKVGVTPIEPWELAQAWSVGSAQSRSKVVTLSDAEKIVARHRATGRRVVFTNGCFDLLHHGHVVLLERARALGDTLIVGLNSDESIRRLKGEQRPVADEQARARVMSAISSVDHIVFFGEDTPMDVIERLRPDVLVKGSDYDGRAVVGREFVEGYGGVVELVPLELGVSTSRILDRLSGRERSPE